MQSIVVSVIVWLTGILFLVLFFPVTLVIWFVVLPFDRDKSVIHWILTLQAVLFISLMPAWKVKVEGRKKSYRSNTYVIISNHQSIMDILVLFCLRYRFRWISKAENMKVPFLGWYLRMAGYITVDRQNDESKAGMLARSYTSLKEGTSIMIFPEGTRSTDGKIGPFKRGAFQLALETGVSILPVIIDGTGEILPKHGLLFREKRRISVKVLDPVPASAFGTSDVNELGAAFRDRMISALNDLREKSGKK